LLVTGCWSLVAGNSLLVIFSPRHWGHDMLMYYRWGIEINGGCTINKFDIKIMRALARIFICHKMEVFTFYRFVWQRK